MEELADDRAASNYINAIISDSPDLLPVALRDVARARRMSAVAERAEIPRESLYGMLSEDSNPTLDNLTAILGAVGLKIQVAPIEESAKGVLTTEPGSQSIFNQPPLAKDVLGETANGGIGFRSVVLISAAQSATGLAFNQQQESQFGIIQRELAEERGEPAQWNPMNLAQLSRQHFPSENEFPMSSSTKPMPTTYSWNRLLGT
jgi:probable addiction module antidote protein